MIDTAAFAGVRHRPGPLQVSAAGLTGWPSIVPAPSLHTTAPIARPVALESHHP